MNIPHDGTFGGAHRTEASSLLDGFPFLHVPAAMIYYCEFLNVLENCNRTARAQSALTYVLRKCHDATCGVMLF